MREKSAKVTTNFPKCQAKKLKNKQTKTSERRLINSDISCFGSTSFEWAIFKKKYVCVIEKIKFKKNQRIPKK